MHQCSEGYQSGGHWFVISMQLWRTRHSGIRNGLVCAYCHGLLYSLYAPYSRVSINLSTTYSMLTITFSSILSTFHEGYFMMFSLQFPYLYNSSCPYQTMNCHMINLFKESHMTECVWDLVRRLWISEACRNTYNILLASEAVVYNLQMYST